MPNAMEQNKIIASWMFENYYRWMQQILSKASAALTKTKTKDPTLDLRMWGAKKRNLLYGVSSSLGIDLIWWGHPRTWRTVCKLHLTPKIRVGHPHICSALWKLNENTGKMQSNSTLPEPATGLHVFMILVLQFGGIRAWGMSSICFNRFQHSMIQYLLFTIAIIRISSNSSASIFLEAVHVCLLHADV